VLESVYKDKGDLTALLPVEPSHNPRAWGARVAEAAVAYEARWSYAALARVDRELLDRFEEQRHLWYEAKRALDYDEMATHGAAMVRAYDAVTQAMEAAPHDAYMIGRCPRTGTQIAVGRGSAPAMYVNDVVYLTIDEVATLLAEQPGFSEIARVKAIFPGATVATARELADDDVPF
jgi:hypothetical protein